MRAANEDFCVADPGSGVFIVADGMGGHAAGEVASQIAATAFEKAVLSSSPGVGTPELMRRAVEIANERVYETQKLRPECRGMGSTLTALIFSDDRYYLAQVGDSRAYLLRQNRLSQLTRDHSLVWPLYENGILSKAELSRHPQKNLITRSVGTQPRVDPDLEDGPVYEEDVFLLCSDGLTDVLTDDDIARVLSHSGSTEEMSDVLIQTANARGGPDNVTAIVIRLSDDEH